MNYIKKDNEIIITGKEDFNPKHILECGQIFLYQKKDEGYVVYSKDKQAEIVETERGYRILGDAEYFEVFFDLKTDYGKIKKELEHFPIMKTAIPFGHGIRILKQDLFEVVISFIISANNNIKRIQSILFKLKEKCGGVLNANKLKELIVKDFSELGAGYRAAYLYKVLRQLDEFDLQNSESLETSELRIKLQTLSGVGPKVADCILLFGYGRTDVFPVDTWIDKVYNSYFGTENNRNKIREELVKTFGSMAGYAQQYLFYYKRELDSKKE